MKTEYEVKQFLLAGNTIRYEVWSFTKDSWSCTEGCCDDGGLIIDEVVANIKYLCRSKWGELRCN